MCRGLQQLTVACHSATGAVLWRAGRKGQGPGEFSLLYRLAETANGDLLALDLAGQRISRFSTHGKLLGTIRLPIFFRQVNSLVARPDGGFAISGFTPGAGEAESFAVHLFSDSGLYQGSFGSLPEVANREVLNFLGSGPLRAGPDGSLLYTRLQPYELIRRGADGVLQRTALPPILRAAEPAAAYVLENTATERRVSRSPEPVLMPSVTLPLSRGGVLATVQLERQRGQVRAWWMVSDSSGQDLHRAELPPEVLPLSLQAIAANDQVLWAIGEKAGEPVVWRFRIRWGSAP